MDNKYTGAVAIDIDGKPFKIFFDWDALAVLKSKFKADVISDLFKDPKPDMLAEILAIGLARNHPEMTAKVIKKLSPPFILTVNAIDKALTYAYFGPDQPAAPDGSKKKKSAKKRTK